ncbi:MAG: lysophospholipase [Verrucomicrobia bacterium]|nr:lysophospholipase [Verrucomicrobiota bacterium]
MNTQKTLRTSALVLSVLLVLFLTTDFIYSRLITSRLAIQEARIERDSNGVRAGCEAFSTGESSVGLLMIHGFADSPFLFREMAPLLAESGFRVRALRLPGFAESPERYGESDLNLWRNRIREEFDSLSKECKEVWLVGHSLGGALAIDFSLREQERADGLVLIAPLLEVSSRRIPILSPRTWFRISRALTFFTDTVQSVFPVDAHDPEVRATYPRDTFIPLRIYSEMFQLLDELERTGRQVKQPMLMILAKDDQVIDPKAAEIWFQQNPSERKKLVFQPDAGHVIPRDYGWTNVVKEIRSFITPR